VRLRAELMGHDARLRNFTLSRDRLVATGQDANAAYREILSRREQVMAELKKLEPSKGPAAAGATFPPFGRGSLVSRPVASARFDTPLHNPWFGYSGHVQMGRAEDGQSWVPSAVHGTADTEPTGSIETAELGDVGEIRFSGHLVAGPYPGHENIEQEHLWEHNWHNLIPFPAPVVASIFTYTIDVYALVSSSLVLGFTSFWSYVYVGEASNFVGQQVPALTEAGWPLVVIDNFDGNGLDKVTVQRSFFVDAGHVPAVALVLGVIAGLEKRAEILFNPSAACWLLPGSFSGGYEGGGIVHFRYDPLPPEVQT
jgi:hypothetical protein